MARDSLEPRQPPSEMEPHTAHKFQVGERIGPTVNSKAVAKRKRIASADEKSVEPQPLGFSS